jgi:type I restriction enzyme S subunit
MGQSPPSSTYNTRGEGLPFFQGKADFGDLHPTARVYCSKPKKVAEAGDILISVRAPVGPTNICPEKACIGRGLAAIRGYEWTDPKYLFYFLRFYEPVLVDEGKGSTFSAISRSDLEEIEIPLRALPAQKHIAGILAKADRVRRLRRYARELSDGYLQSVFLEMFGDPVTNPMGWETTNLEEFASVNRGKFSPRPRNDPRYYGGGYPFIQTGDIARSDGFLSKWTQTLNERGVRVSRAFDPGTVVIAIVGATIGETAILGIRAYCPDSVIGMRPDPKFATPEYIEHLLRFWKPVFRERAPETARANINLETLRPLPVALPPILLQRRFSEVVHSIERLRAQQREAERQAEHLFQTLLHRAFRGEV